MPSPRHSHENRPYLKSYVAECHRLFPLSRESKGFWLALAVRLQESVDYRYRGNDVPAGLRALRRACPGRKYSPGKRRGNAGEPKSGPLWEAALVRLYARLWTAQSSLTSSGIRCPAAAPDFRGGWPPFPHGSGFPWTEPTTPASRWPCRKASRCRTPRGRCPRCQSGSAGPPR